MTHRIVYEPVHLLPEATRNAKAHDSGAQAASVSRFGFIEPVVVDGRTGRLVSGHGRRDDLLRREEAGESPPDGIELDENGRWTVPVVHGWSSRDDLDAEGAGIALNRVGEKGGWDDNLLADTLIDLSKVEGGLDGIGFADDDLANLAEKLGRDIEVAGHRRHLGPGDDTPDWDGAVPDVPTAKRGDLWSVGPHLVLCGDSFDADTVDRLLGGQPAQMVATDPPYAIYGSATGIASDIADDAMVQPFFTAMWRTIHRALEDFGHAYVCCDWRSYPSVVMTAKGSGMDSKNCIVWDKGGSGLGSNYANTHEFVAFFARLPPSGAMTGSRKAGQRSVFASNIMRHNRPTGDDRQHNAAKPVDLLRNLIRNSSNEGDRVLDLFAGSGSCGVAAAAEDRCSLMLEKEPAMVDVIVARMEKVTGETGRLV